MPHSQVNDLQAVLWDLDGTLIDSESVWLEAETRTMAAHGVTWTAADQEWCLGGPMERVADYMSTRIQTVTGQTIAPQRLSGELQEQMEFLLTTQPPNWRPGAIDLLGQLTAAGIPTALVTASHRRLLDALSLPTFAVSIAGDEVARTKPDPLPYLTAAKRLDVSIEKCIVLEDSPTGVASGLASGALVVAIPHVASVPAGPRCHVVSSLTDVSVDSLRHLLATTSTAR